MPIPDHGLSDEYLREIGCVAVEWSRVELAMEAAIWALMYCDELNTSPWFSEDRGRAVTTHINPLLRVDVMLSLARVSIPPEWGHVIGYLVDVAKRLRDAYPKRNRIVHGLWEPLDSPDAFRRTYRARGDVSAFHETVSLDEIKAVSSETAKLTAALTELTEIIGLVFAKRTTRPRG